MAHILLLHDHSAYTSRSLAAGGLGGTESSVIYLGEALARAGHHVAAANRLAGPVEDPPLAWLPLPLPRGSARADVAIAINQARLLDGVRAKRKVVWLHNPTSLWRQLKRANLTSLWRHRPDAVLLGAYHDRSVPQHLPFARRVTIPHGIGPEFLGATLRPAGAPRVLFASQPYRGLDWLVSLWLRRVFPQVPGAELHVFVPKDDQVTDELGRLERFGIHVRGSIDREALAQEMRQARVMWVAGHKDETFCLAAAEAIASGLPVMTRGIGSLAERVIDGQTGYIRDQEAEFAERAVALLTDDGSWQAMHRAALEAGERQTWDEVARQWQATFPELAGTAP